MILPALSLTGGALLAAAAPTPTAPPAVDSLLQYGAIGVLASLGIFVSWTLYKRLESAYRREQARGDRMEEELRSLNRATQDLMTGALRDATSAVAEALEVINAEQHQRKPVPRRRAASGD